MHKSGAITALAAHEKWPLMAAGTADGIVSVYAFPFFQVLRAGGGGGGGAGSGGGGVARQASVGSGGDDDATEASDLQSGGAGAPKPKPARNAAAAAAAASAAAAAAQAPILLFAAAVSPEYAIVSGRVKCVALAAQAAAAAAAASGRGSSGYFNSSGPIGAAAGVAGVTALTLSQTPYEFLEAVTALAFHPLLPLLAAADDTGRVVLWRVGIADGAHATVASRDATAPPSSFDGSPRVISSLSLHPTVPHLLRCRTARTAPARRP
jgi:hypothetical protein